PRDDNERGDGSALSEEQTEPDTASLTASETLPGADSEPLDTDFDNVWSDETRIDAAPTNAGGQSGAGPGGGGDYDGNILEQTVAESISLRDHLIGQLSETITDPTQRLIGVHLIDALDDAGYIVTPLNVIAAQLGCLEEAVEAVLLQMQDFDPLGVLARDLAECLAIQLRAKDRFDPAMQALVANLELLAKRDVTSLLRLFVIDMEDLSDMVLEIRALNPKPAMVFSTETVQPVVPDITMARRADGGWMVELNPETLPRVLLNQRYFQEVRAKARDKAEREYVSEQFQSASWLVRSLHQRATTILKVATELVRQQQSFFTKGVQHLRPLVLRDIAEVIGMHESTVSRVTTNKFIATPRGIFELKYFFTTAIASRDGGAAHSAEAVRQRIRALIEEEQAGAILSDDQIVAALSANGVDIARRTVAKYREAMHIPSSVQRRREKSSKLAI
ncbi:MAG: RNA polymerase factor sigma-54, partial [Alphaproteobacteria bacterium]